MQFLNTRRFIAPHTISHVDAFKYWSMFFLLLLSVGRSFVWPFACRHSFNTRAWEFVRSIAVNFQAPNMICLHSVWNVWNRFHCRFACSFGHVCIYFRYPGSHFLPSIDLIMHRGMKTHTHTHTAPFQGCISRGYFHSLFLFFQAFSVYGWKKYIFRNK